MTTGIRFLRALKCKGGEPVVYMNFAGEGWFSLRQLTVLFFPDKTEDGLKLTLWCAKNIQGCKYYDTSLSECTCVQLQDQKILKLLRGAQISVRWVVDVQTAQKILHVLDPLVRASVVLAFNHALTEFLRKGGRKRAVSNKERMLIAASQGWKCKHCSASFGKDLAFEIDHIFSWSRGGSTSQINLQALCPTCHAKKSNREKQEIFEPFRCG